MHWTIRKDSRAPCVRELSHFSLFFLSLLILVISVTLTYASSIMPRHQRRDLSQLHGPVPRGTIPVRVPGVRGVTFFSFYFSVFCVCLSVPLVLFYDDDVIHGHLIDWLMPGCEHNERFIRTISSRLRPRYDNRRAGVVYHEGTSRDYG